MLVCSCACVCMTKTVSCMRAFLPPLPSPCRWPQVRQIHPLLTLMHPCGAHPPCWPTNHFEMKGGAALKGNCNSWRFSMGRDGRGHRRQRKGSRGMFGISLASQDITTCLPKGFLSAKGRLSPWLPNLNQTPSSSTPKTLKKRPSFHAKTYPTKPYINSRASEARGPAPPPPP